MINLSVKVSAGSFGVSVTHDTLGMVYRIFINCAYVIILMRCAYTKELGTTMSQDNIIFLTQRNSDFFSFSWAAEGGSDRHGGLVVKASAS